ncbi:tetratricopeptide repeat protein [Parvibaculum lavamentivorans]|nr:tetratricopeptide repeat protein [Parvibaculum lavamentivorans]
MSSQPHPVRAHGLDIGRTLKQAMRLHEKGRHEQAEKRYAKILQADPDHSDALHLMGVMAHQSGRNADALRLIRRSLELDPQFADAHFNLGLIHEAEGQLEEAESAYSASIDINPRNAKAALNLGNLFFRDDRFEEALQCYDTVLAIRPADALAHKNRSRALRSLKNIEASLEAIERAVELRPDDTILQFEYANALRDEGEVEKAVLHYEEALRLQPDQVSVLCNLGGTLKDVNRPDEAKTTLERAIGLDPECTEARINLANLAHDQEEYQKAIDLVEEALEIRPDYPEAYCTLGRVLGAEAMNDEALAAFQKAIELSPTFAEAYVNLGSILQTIGQPESALKAYEIALNIKPKMDMAYWNLALALLSVGRLDEGWSLFGYGFTSKQRAPYRPFPGLLWDGEDISDKTLFVWREQGIGDDLRFSTVYQDLYEKAGHLIIETDKRLVPLYQRTWPNATVRPETGASTGLGNMDQPDFDVTAPAGMAASFIRRSLDNFPTHPQPLVANPEVRKRCMDWLNSLGPGPKVGFAWRSKLMTKTRAIYHTAIDDWSDLLSTPGATFINLQYDNVDKELCDLKEKHGITVHQMPDLDLYNDLDGAAALTSAVDLIVTSPTSVLDIAGTQQKPTFGYAMSCHPMQLGTDHFPWFPNVRLYSLIERDDHRKIITTITQDVRTYLDTLKD